MRASDIVVAARDARVPQHRLCGAIRTLLPVLKALRAARTGWKFWLSWGMGVLIAALEEFQAERCDYRSADAVTDAMEGLPGK